MSGTLVDVDLVVPTDADTHAKFSDPPFGITTGTTRNNIWVRKVAAGSPAEGAGVQPNDVVVSFLGSEEFQATFANKAIEHYRHSKTFSVRLRRPAPRGRPKTDSPQPPPAVDPGSDRSRTPTPAQRKRLQRQCDSDEKKSDEKEKAKERMNAARRNATPEQRRSESLRSRERRADFTAEEWEAEKERLRDRRGQLSPEELEAEKERLRERRADLTTEEWEAEKKRLRERRADLTTEEWAAEKERLRDRRENLTEADKEKERKRKTAALAEETESEREARLKSSRLRRYGPTGWEGVASKLGKKEAQKARTEAERIAELSADAAATSSLTAAHLDSGRPQSKRSRTSYLGAKEPSDLASYHGLRPIHPEGQELAPPGDAPDPRQVLAYDAQESLEAIWVSGLEPEYHSECLFPPHAVNIAVVNRAMDLIREHVEQNRADPRNVTWQHLEILPTAPFSMMGRDPAVSGDGPPPIRPMNRLPPLPDTAEFLLLHSFRSLCVVYIGDGGVGHYVVLLTDGCTKEVKVFDSYSSLTRTNDYELRHLAVVGATMLRLKTSEGIILTFPKVPEQDHSLNSCGSFAVLLATAVVMGVWMNRLVVTNEVLLRRRLHDHVWCQPANGVPELTALLYALEDFGGGPLVQAESGFGTRCAHCSQLPLNYGADGRPELTLDFQEQNRLRRGEGANSPFQGPHLPDNPDPLEMELSEQSEDEDPAIAGREVSPVGEPRTAQKAPKSSTPRGRKKKKWEYEELKVLKRPGAPEKEASCCPWCGAFLFAAEAGSATAVTKQWCCGKGTHVVPPLQPYQFSLYDEGRRIDPRFKAHARQLNNMFTLAAGGVSGKWLQQPGGTSFVRCEGKIYRRLYDLSWRNQRGHRSSQLCILDPAFRNTEASSMKIALDVVAAVADYLFQSNQLYSEYKRLDTITGIPTARVVFKTVTRAKDGNILGDPVREPQQNLFPTFDEVSAILVTEEQAQPREVAVWKHGHASSILMSHLDPKYEALAFPLLRPFAEAGWHQDFVSTTGQRITHLQYQRQLFLTQARTWELDRLGQEAALDAVSRIQESRLMWVRTHQDELRLGSREEIVARLGEDDDALDAGHRIVLPASFTGSPRYMQNLYEDAMAIVGRYGKPTFFLTVTTNPNWPELNPGRNEESSKLPPKTDSEGRLPPNARPSKGPGLISRVFELKLRQLIRDIRSGKLFDSKCLYLISTVEYQKRGLPHAHLLFKLEQQLPVADVGKFIKTDIPGIEDPVLREQVLKHQIHGPCSGTTFITNCPCLDKKTRRCTKHFPKPANEVPHTDDRGYPHYRRTREEKAIVRKAQKDMEVDDRWVVPYSDRILRKYDCHNNLEYASSGLTCKYLFKYTHKGPDKAAMVMAEDGARVDECQDFENRRVMGAAEAHSRIYGFDIHCRSPAVKPLSVHLPDQNKILHKKGELQAALKKTSLLERYLSRPEGPPFDEMRLQHYYELFLESLRPTKDSTPHPDGLHHISPRKKGELITRIYWVGASRTEQFFLRMLLARFPARSYLELRTVRGIQYETFQQAAMAHGLCKDNQEFFIALDEASGFLMGPGLRMLYVTMIVGLQGSAPRALWDDERTQKHLTEDFRHRGMSTAAALNEALIHISRLLESNGKSLAWVGLPECQDTSSEVGRELSRWDREEQRAFVEQWIPRLNAQQRRVVDALLAQMPERLSLHIDWPPLSDPEQILGLPPQPFTLNRPASSASGPKTFFLLAPGGSGKSLTLNFVTAHLRSMGHVVLCTASTGIAALNFPGGMTAHGMFKLPVLEDEGEVGSTLSMRSQRAEMIRKASAIIIDEAANMRRNLIRAVERLLEEIKSPNLRFIIYVGDLCQIPPVVKWGSKADILRASIRFDDRWDSYTKLTLTKNERAAKDPEYAAWAASIGNGTAPTVTLPNIPYPLTPLSLIAAVKSRDELLAFVYPNLGDPYECSQRAILAGTNAQIDDLNEEVLGRLEGPTEVLYSADSLKNIDQEDMHVGTEVLGQLSAVGIPPHRLELKVGAVAIIVRNLNSTQRLCNSTKVIIREIKPSRRLVMVEIPRDGGPGEIIPIPRITFEFSPGGTGMTILRKQFPLRIAYSLTHNKSQGQTLKKVGLDLTEDVFAHGQLYVDVTRVEHRDNIRVLAPESRVVEGIGHVLNVVYEELIDGSLAGGGAEAADVGGNLEAEEDVEPDPAVYDDDEPEL